MDVLTLKVLARAARYATAARAGAANLQRMAEDFRDDPVAAGEALRQAADLDRFAEITEAALSRAAGTPVHLRPPDRRPPERG